jgi:glycosyltransferase involved in cell wall biosynthesis
MQPVVSFVVPLLNGVTYLREAVDSLLGQTFHDFEIIVVDDGSTDGSIELLAGISDARLRLVQNSPSRGLAGSLNQGIALARGSYIARMDADDVSLPERLSVQIKFLEAHPEVAVCGTWAKHIDASGAEFGPRRTPVGKEMASEFWKPSPMIHPSVVARRTVLQAFPYDEALRGAEDYDLWLRLRKQFALENIPEFLLLYRIHDRCATLTGADRELHTTYDIFRRHCTDRISYEEFCSIIREDFALSVASRLRTTLTLARALHIPYRIFFRADWRYCRRRIRKTLRTRVLGSVER